MAKTPTENAVNQAEPSKSYTFDKSAVKTKKHVTLPLLPQVENGTIYCAFLHPIYQGKEMKAADAKAGEDKKERPATLATVCDLETGTPKTVVLTAVEVGNILENYPDKSYVGKSFSMSIMAKQKGKRYRPVSVVEIDTPEGLDLTAMAESVVAPSAESIAIAHADRITGEITEESVNTEK